MRVDIGLVVNFLFVVEIFDNRFYLEEGRTKARHIIISLLFVRFYHASFIVICIDPSSFSWVNQRTCIPLQIPNSKLDNPNELTG